MDLCSDCLLHTLPFTPLSHQSKEEACHLVSRPVAVDGRTPPCCPRAGDGSVAKETPSWPSPAPSITSPLTALDRKEETAP